MDYQLRRGHHTSSLRVEECENHQARRAPGVDLLLTTPCQCRRGGESRNSCSGSSIVYRSYGCTRNLCLNTNRASRMIDCSQHRIRFIRTMVLIGVCGRYSSASASPRIPVAKKGEWRRTRTWTHLRRRRVVLCTAIHHVLSCAIRA
jgi:hypothetical protein